MYETPADFCGVSKVGRARSKIIDRLPRKVGNGLLHAMLHVLDIDDSLDFYEKQGMKVLSCNRRPNGAATAFVGYGKLRDMCSFALELAASKGKTVDVGSFGGLLLTGEASESLDPNGYVLRYGEKSGEASILALSIQVKDLQRSTSFYEKLGMMKEDDGAFKEKSAKVAYLKYLKGPKTYLRLEEAEEAIDVGSGLDHLVVSTPNVQRAADELEQMNVKLTMKPTVMFGLKIMGVQDEDGYKTFLVDEDDFKASAPKTASEK